MRAWSQAHSRDGVEDVTVEVGVVHHRRVAALHARTPLRPEAVVEALAAAPLAAAAVESVGVHPEEPHLGVQLADLAHGCDAEKTSEKSGHLRLCATPTAFLWHRDKGQETGIRTGQNNT